MSNYYKTNAPSVLTAWEIYRQQLDQMRDEGFAFRDSFAAKDAIFCYSIDDSRFFGLTFEEPKDTRFWTHPDRNSETQSPRKKVTRMTADEKSQHTQLLKQWSDNYPKTRANKHNVYAALGTDWGMVFLAGLVFFEHQGFVYVEANLTLQAPAIEILGSEYAAAKAAYQAGEKS